MRLHVRQDVCPWLGEYSLHPQTHASAHRGIYTHACMRTWSHTNQAQATTRKQTLSRTQPHLKLHHGPGCRGCPITSALLPAAAAVHAHDLEPLKPLAIMQHTIIHRLG